MKSWRVWYRRSWRIGTIVWIFKRWKCQLMATPGSFPIYSHSSCIAILMFYWQNNYFIFTIDMRLNMDDIVVTLSLFTITYFEIPRKVKLFVKIVLFVSKHLKLSFFDLNRPKILTLKARHRRVYNYWNRQHRYRSMFQFLRLLSYYMAWKLRFHKLHPTVL